MSSPRDAGRGGRPNRPRRAGADGAGGRGPRPPLKGRRRTFDTDSAPNERERGRDGVHGEDWSQDRWVDEGPVRRAAGDAVRRGGSPARAGSRRNDARDRRRAAERAEAALELDRARLVRELGQARADRTIQRLGEASRAFADQRFDDASRLLKPIAATIPDEPSVRELYGLTLYRLGRWRRAITELEAFARHTGSTEQHPVLADCRRALGHHRAVAKLWEELGAASPDAATVAEGRIVHAGSLADQGDLVGAIAALEAGALGGKKLAPHHLRMRYALGDLYERAGEHQAARRQFQTVADADPGFFDVQERLRQL